MIKTKKTIQYGINKYLKDYVYFEIKADYLSDSIERVVNPEDETIVDRVVIKRRVFIIDAFRLVGGIKKEVELISNKASYKLTTLSGILNGKSLDNSYLDGTIDNLLIEQIGWVKDNIDQSEQTEDNILPYYYDLSSDDLEKV